MPKEPLVSGYAGCRDVLLARLAERGPGRIQLLVGPRQVGKTTLLLEIAGRFGGEAIYAAMDGPEASLPGHWERLWGRVEEVAAARGRAIVLLDEVQAVGDWAGRLKGEWDRLRRVGRRVRVVATGSSALRVGMGSRESLAGRFERLVLGHWSAGSLASVFGMGGREAARLVVERGGYPGAVGLLRDPGRWASYVREAILEPAIGRDALAGAAVRRPGLLRQVFGACVSSPAQVVSLQKLQGSLTDRGALETLAHYLWLLEEAFLVAVLSKHGTRPLRQRAAPPKLVVLSNAFLAVTDPRGVPDREREPERFGRWVENACLAHAWSSGQRVTYWRREPFEVDGVIEGSWGSWAIEVKAGAVGAADLRGLGEFTRRFRGYRPLVVCDASERRVVERLGFPARAWEDFLLEGPGE